MKHGLILVFLIGLLPYSLLSQDSKTSNFYTEIKKLDISAIWIQDKIIIEDGEETIIRPEPLGFIGDDYYRFYIHFVSAIQNKDNTYQYFIYGKTKLKENICAFQGTLNIIEANLYNSSDAPGFKEGFVKANYTFFEDAKQKGSGKLVGTCTTYFLIDKSGKLRYNALMLVADGFENNQFKGIWQSYNSKEIKVCNWGDFRIPESGPLDSGAGEFMITEKYREFGWDNYAKAWLSNNTEAENSRKLEKQKWWE